MCLTTAWYEGSLLASDLTIVAWLFSTGRECSFDKNIGLKPSWLFPSRLHLVHKRYEKMVVILLLVPWVWYLRKLHRPALWPLVFPKFQKRSRLYVRSKYPQACVADLLRIPNSLVSAPAISFSTILIPILATCAEPFLLVRWCAGLDVVFQTKISLVLSLICVYDLILCSTEPGPGKFPVSIKTCSSYTKLGRRVKSKFHLDYHQWR